MKEDAARSFWGKLSAGLLAIALVFASLDMVLNADTEKYNVSPILGMLSAGYLCLDGLAYLVIGRRSHYSPGRLITAILFIVSGLLLFFVSDTGWMDYSFVLSIYYLTLGYARERINADYLHKRFALFLGAAVVMGCVIGLLLRNEFFSGIYTFGALIIFGILVAVIASAVEMRYFKFQVLASIEYWSVASFVIIFCCVSLLPQVIY